MRELWHKLSFLDRLVVITLLIMGLLGGLAVYIAFKSLLAIICGALVTFSTFLLDIFYASYKDDIAELKEKVDLHCKRGHKYYQGIATSLETIVKIVNSPSGAMKVSDAYKRLSGVKGILEKEIGEEKLEDILKELNKTDKERFIATSIANFADWIDPEWSTYLTRQLIATSKKPESFVAKRYFIYSRDTLNTYDSEIKDLKNCHSEGKTEMNTIELDTFNSWWRSCLKELLESPEINGKYKSELRKIELELEKARNIIEHIPDFVAVNDRFWWRDCNHDWRVVDVHDEEKNKFEAWILFLSKMEKYKSAEYST